MNPKTGAERAGWWFAVKFILTPSLLATAGVWTLTHHPMITYVAFMTVWLFALIGAAFFPKQE